MEEVIVQVCVLFGLVEEKVLGGKVFIEGLRGLHVKYVEDWMVRDGVFVFFLPFGILMELALRGEMGAFLVPRSFFYTCKYCYVA